MLHGRAGARAPARVALRPTAPAHRLTLTTAADPVVVCGERLRVEQVVANLVSNAVKYSPGGGPVAIDVSTGAAHGGRIEVESAPRAGSTFRVRLPLAGHPPLPDRGALIFGGHDTAADRAALQEHVERVPEGVRASV